MKPSLKRFLIFHGVIAVLFFGPGSYLPGMLDDPYWRDFFCHREWYAQWETMLAILVCSGLFHFYWFSRKGAGKSGEAVAATLLVHGLLVLPSFVIIALVHHLLPEPSFDRLLLRGVSLGYLFYWPLIAWLLARLDCIWPAVEGEGRVSLRMRLWLLLILPFTTLVASETFVLGLSGPCFILSMP